MKEDKRRFSSILRDNAIHKMYEEAVKEAGTYAPYLSKGYFYGIIRRKTGLSVRMISQILNHTEKTLGM